jgi:predicted HicB family RNase H-like nuclease
MEDKVPNSVDVSNLKFPKRHQFVFDISPEDKEIIREAARKNNMSMRRWILKAMAESIKKYELENENK